MKVEPDPDVRIFTCAVCANDFRTVFGYVTEVDRPLAIYHADLHVSHPHVEAAVVLTISIGDWSEQANAASRRRARLQATTHGDAVEMTFADFAPGETTERELGQRISAQVARRSADRETYLRVADAVIYGDERVRTVLGVTDKLA